MEIYRDSINIKTCPYCKRRAVVQESHTGNKCFFCGNTFSEERTGNNNQVNLIESDNMGNDNAYDDRKKTTPSGSQYYDPKTKQWRYKTNLKFMGSNLLIVATIVAIVVIGVLVLNYFYLWF